MTFANLTQKLSSISSKDDQRQNFLEIIFGTYISCLYVSCVYPL